MKLKRVYELINRNYISINGEKSIHNIVNLEWWNGRDNVGDYLSSVVFDWMLREKNIDANKTIGETKHLLGIGSIIGTGSFDATVWGSGVHTVNNVAKIAKYKKIIKYDIRALRGPITKDVMKSFGYNCDDVVFGDPAILMPYIYTTKQVKKYEVCVVDHYYNKTELSSDDMIVISANTTDYKSFIDTLVSSKKVISSSLHGIIIAESYGIPALFLCEGMEHQLMKYYDWYYSTGRYNVRIVHSIREGLATDPMELPDLSSLRKGLLNSFPYDLWE